MDLKTAESWLDSWGCKRFLSSPGIHTEVAAQPTIQWMLGTLPHRVKLPGYEADDPRASRAEVKNSWDCVSSQYFFMACRGTILPLAFTSLGSFAIGCLLLV
jgi:hypothetical protein